jgi:hypothetical protein
MNATSCPAAASRAPKYPPTAPAAITAIRIAPDGERRKAKKSAKKINNDTTAGRAVIWGDPSKAETELVLEGVETAAAAALAFETNITSGEMAIVACITADGIEAFKPWPCTKRVIVGADRDDAPLTYDREREAAAKRLGCRVGILDELVRAASGATASTPCQGRPINLLHPEPSPVAVDGAALLDALSSTIRDYVIVSDVQADAVVSNLRCWRSACMNAAPQPKGLASARFSCALTERLMVLGFVRIDQFKQITCASAIRLVHEVTVASPQIP